jgi:hypothetical protein
MLPVLLVDSSHPTGLPPINRFDQHQCQLGSLAVPAALLYPSLEAREDGVKVAAATVFLLQILLLNYYQEGSMRSLQSG